MCPDPEREFTVTRHDRTFEARVLLDTWPESPREHDTAAELIQFDTSRYRQPDQQARLREEVLLAWDRWHDEELIGRYITLCHDVAAWDYRTPHDGGRLFGYLTHAALRRTWPTTADDRHDPAVAARAALLVSQELDTYQQWVDGDVYIVEVSDPRDERVASLCGIYTTGGSPDDPYLEEIAHELAESLTTTSSSPVDPISVSGPVGVRGAAR